jgi:hypothetical protein
MKKGLRACLPFFFMMGVILLLLPCGAIGAEQPSGPKMVMKELEYDLKTVKEGDVIKHAFQISNQGDQVLEIREVKPG